MHRASRCLLVTLLVAFPSRSALAQRQDSVSTRFASAAPALDSGPQSSGGVLPCPDCNPPKRFWAGAGELMIVQAIPWAFTKYVTAGEWSSISFRTWADNIKFPWQWDNNKFNNNQFAHPYHGSLYFNAGRANGYNFWQSTPWAFGGSLMWELFGEVWAPSPNDLANTTLGGITLGEMLSMPFMNTYWISRSGEASRGQYAGLYTVSWATAQVLGPGTGGQLADAFGFTILWWIISGICALSALGFWLLQLGSGRPGVSGTENAEAAARVFVAVEEDRGAG